MAMTYKRNVAHFVDTVGVEEAEGFLAWLQKHSKPKLNLSACTHVHAAQIPVAEWPTDESLSKWLKSALS
jgi:hypothetical protein